MGIFFFDADDVRDAFAKWKPASCETEALYEAAIYEFLHAQMPKAIFHRQYTHAKTKADIYVEFPNGGSRVVIEVKCKLVTRPEYHRLIGQSWEYLREWKAELVVCICGDSDPALVKLTDEALKVFASNQGRTAHVLALK